MDKTSPKLELILVGWLKDEFDIDTKIHYLTNRGPIIAWNNLIIVMLHTFKVESGSWIGPKDLHQVAIGDPEFFEKLKVLIQIRLKEIETTYGYAGMIK